MKKKIVVTFVSVLGLALTLACDSMLEGETNEGASRDQANARNGETFVAAREGDEIANPGARISQDPILQRLRNKPMRYTRHGECRMECRHISGDEVREILNNGTISHDRTRNDGQCTSYAVEGKTSDEQEVRIVYADCERETRLITAIDLGREWDCECP